MKFLTVPRLQRLSSLLSHVDVGDQIIHARVEAYSCKPAGDDKRLGKQLERQISEELAHSPSLSPSMSPLGPLTDSSTRRLLISLITTMNASFPDYDFSNLRAEQFDRELSPYIAVTSLNSLFLTSLEPIQPGIRAEFWQAIGETIDFPHCELYTYAPHADSDVDAGKLWSVHHFFFHRKEKKVLFVSACAVSKLHAESAAGVGDGDDEVEEDVDMAAVSSGGDDYWDDEAAEEEENNITWDEQEVADAIQREDSQRRSSGGGAAAGAGAAAQDDDGLTDDRQRETAGNGTRRVGAVREVLKGGEGRRKAKGRREAAAGETARYGSRPADDDEKKKRRKRRVTTPRAVAAAGERQQKRERTDMQPAAERPAGDAAGQTELQRERASLRPHAGSDDEAGGRSLLDSTRAPSPSVTGILPITTVRAENNGAENGETAAEEEAR